MSDPLHDNFFSKRLPDAVMLPAVSYHEVIQLAYYGASVIHPKIVKPLQNKNIPLYIRSFVNPVLPGTVIHGDGTHDAYKKDKLFAALNLNYQVHYNEGLALLTIRHYTEPLLHEHLKGKEVLPEQRPRHTVRLVVKS